MLKNNFLKAVLSQSALILVNLLSGFLFVPYLLKTVGSEAYGFYPLSKNIIKFGTLITTILTTFIAKFITVEYLEKNYKKMNVFFSSSVFVNIVTGIVVAVPLFIFALTSGKILKVPEYLVFQVKMLFVFVSLAFFTAQMKNTFSVATISTDKRYISTLIRALENGVSVIFPVVLFTLFGPSVSYAGLSFFVAMLITLAISVKIQKKIMPQAKFSYDYAERKVVQSLITSGGWHSLGQISIVIFSGVDLLLANILLGTKAQTLCSLALIIPNLLKSGVIFLTNWLLPFLSVLSSDEQKAELSEKFDAFVKYMSVTAAIVASVVIGFGDSFLKLWLGNFYSHQIYVLLAISSLSVYVYGSFVILNTVLLVHNHPKFPAFVTVLSGILNIPLSVILVKHMGVYGIFVSSLLLNFLVYAVFMPRYLSFRTKFPSKSIYRPFYKSVAVLLFGTALCIVIKNFIIPDTYLKLLLMIVAVAVIILAAVFVKVFSAQDLKFIIEIIKAKINYGNDADEIQN